MAEYIEREALLEALKEFRLNETMSKHLTREDCETARNVIERAQMVIELIPAADVAPVQQWISVKDRLPEESGLYITFGCTAVPVRWLHNFDKDIGKFGAWWDYDTDGKKHPRYRFIEEEDITHWMPLPEPPKGE